MYPCSNGMVERFHGVVRRRLATLDPSLPLKQRIHQVLLWIRTSVHRMIGIPPAEALFGRPIRGRLPISPRGPIIHKEEQIRQKIKMTVQHDKKRNVRDLPTLQPGSRVLLQDGYMREDKEWEVVRQEGRQVVLDDGVRTALRNRQHVRPVDPPSSQSNPQSGPEPPVNEERHDEATGKHHLTTNTPEPIAAQGPGQSTEPQAPQQTQLRRSARVSRPVERLDL